MFYTKWVCYRGEGLLSVNIHCCDALILASGTESSPTVGLTAAIMAPWAYCTSSF